MAGRDSRPTREPHIDPTRSTRPDSARTPPSHPLSAVPAPLREPALPASYGSAHEVDLGRAGRPVAADS